MVDYQKLSKHHTMLVHESSANMDHEEMARIIQREIWDKADYEAGKGVDRLKELLKTILDHIVSLLSFLNHKHKINHPVLMN